LSRSLPPVRNPQQSAIIERSRKLCHLRIHVAPEFSSVKISSSPFPCLVAIIFILVVWDHQPGGCGKKELVEDKQFSETVRQPRPMKNE
jgi:hypothetical protein